MKIPALLISSCLTIALGMVPAGSFADEAVRVDEERSEPMLAEATPVPIGLPVSDDATVEASVACPHAADRIWIINTRRMTSNVCYADLEQPQFSISRLSPNGCATSSSFDEYQNELVPGRTTAIYVHGYRFKSSEATRRGLLVHRQVAHRRGPDPIDWVIWSWPSEKETFIGHDIREKAKYTDTQGLYLAWLLKKHVAKSVPTTLIGYSFGGRVVTGSLHALAGGSLGGRSLPCDPIVNARIDVGLVAPAIEKDWLAPCQYHALATSNMDQLLLLYNQRDSVLKRYWLLDRVRGSMAIGFGQLQSFAPRSDGSGIWLRARDCSPSIGSTHDELDYYHPQCSAGTEMALLLNDALIHH